MFEWISKQFGKKSATDHSALPSFSNDVLDVIRKATGQTPRAFSTFDFGRAKDERHVSILVEAPSAEPSLEQIRDRLPESHFAFLGTERWISPHFGPTQEQLSSNREFVELVVIQSTDQFQCLHVARSNGINFDIDTQGIHDQLRRWHDVIGIDIKSAGTDFVRLEFLNTPADIKKFCEELFAFCPDIVEEFLTETDLASLEDLSDEERTISRETEIMISAAARQIRQGAMIELWWD